MHDPGLGLPIKWDESSFTQDELKHFSKCQHHIGDTIKWRGELVKIVSVYPFVVEEIIKEDV